MYNLDTKNKKILSELELNARIPYSILARKVGISKQVAKYRVEKLEKDEIIQGYNAIIDVNKVAKTIYLVYFKLIKMSSDEEKKWIKDLNQNVRVALTAKNAGEWDLTVVIICKNNQELDSIIKNITRGKSKNIKEKLITSELESTYFNLKLLYGQDVEFTTSSVQSIVNLDKKDSLLLNYLAEDCRVSLLDLAKKINMSPNGVKGKIKALEKKKLIIAYKAKINYEKLGFLHFRVLLHLDKFTTQLYSKIKTFLKEKGNVESVGRYVGYADVDFRCYAKDIVDFYNLISSIKNEFVENIIEVDSMLIFNWEKIKYN